MGGRCSRAQDFRHQAGTPFWCYALVTGDGEQVSQCYPYKEACANELRQTQNAGQPVLTGCAETSSVDWGLRAHHHQARVRW